MKFLLLFIMIFCHIVDDYYLQGILASMKQSKWWETNAPDEMYKNDYKAALAAHAFSWAFMIMLPLLIYAITHNYDGIFYGYYVPALLGNAALHCYIDNLKANKHAINLITDQALHMAQIAVTYIWFFVITLI